MAGENLKRMKVRVKANRAAAGEPPPPTPPGKAMRLGPKASKSKCPNDTNGDGDCGQKTCPFCHPECQPVESRPAELVKPSEETADVLKVLMAEADIAAAPDSQFIRHSVLQRLAAAIVRRYPGLTAGR